MLYSYWGMLYNNCMTNQDIENIETVDITVTQESLDAHVQCLKENRYRIAKPFTLFTGNMLWLTIGMFVGVMLTGQVVLG